MNSKASTAERIETMLDMTDTQYKNAIELILEIAKSCKSKKEIVQKLEKIVNSLNKS